MLAVPILAPDAGSAAQAGSVAGGVPLDETARAEVEAFLADREHSGRAGLLEVLPRPLRTPRRLLLVGVGAGAEEGWRAAGAAVARFGGILAVGLGSVRGPRLLQMSWRPGGAARHGAVRHGSVRHVVLIGKGITFGTGGIVIKPREAMKLMRKDITGAAAVSAAVLTAAALRLPVRVTALAPLAENMVSGSSYRPGDVVRHYGGLTGEIRNTDAEGRLVRAHALAYAVSRLAPDMVVDLATLTTCVSSPGPPGTAGPTWTCPRRPGRTAPMANCARVPPAGGAHVAALAGISALTPRSGPRPRASSARSA